MLLNDRLMLSYLVGTDTGIPCYMGVSPDRSVHNKRMLIHPVSYTHLDVYKRQRRRAYKATTNSRHAHPLAPNLLARRFSFDKPDTCLLYTSRGADYESPTAYFLSIKKVGKER